MKRKILIGLLLAIIIIALATISYYMLVDIETKEPKEIIPTCEIQEEQFMGRKIFIVKPKNKNNTSKKILYFHGGAYVAEASNKHWEFIEKIVNDTGVTLIMPDYPLTPKYNYKDVSKMVVPFYKELIDRVDSKDLILMGDSAGGGIGLALEEKIGEENLQMPSKTILISPWLDVRLENPKIEEVQKNDSELNKETLKLAGLSYAGEDGINNYFVNPIDGDLSKLKNITIFTGTYDILYPDIKLLQQKAQTLGIQIDVKEYEQAKHIWMIEENTSEELNSKGYNDVRMEIENCINYIGEN